jgi:hypothetical protein
MIAVGTTAEPANVLLIIDKQAQMNKSVIFLIFILFDLPLKYYRRITTLLSQGYHQIMDELIKNYYCVTLVLTRLFDKTIERL